MKMRAAGFLLVVVTVSAAGCGDALSEASAQACSEGRSRAAQAREFVENGPPELMVELARTTGPEFGKLAEKADDEDVSAALAELSRTFEEFEPDMSKVPTALQRYPEFDRYIEDFKASVRNHSEELNTACA
ncbi:hypothetical protein [Actinophytocola xanthii]|uniref:Haemophore haem-binding domain-containing protein n=1 Tax=Actinophytocola xanthii TaxID=1912961 RepID=A0A1Q8CXT4_9PSEU|nr:hypothetical protein [Actinophytocola xanthii]OLF19153.1 hypothetical protein BU204_01925 [Actinophytocola xanthii]